ncbi:hypothetical protein OKW33_003349 [Paraburkholderia atlantica]
MIEKDMCGLFLRESIPKILVWSANELRVFYVAEGGVMSKRRTKLFLHTAVDFFESTPLLDSKDSCRHLQWLAT